MVEKIISLVAAFNDAGELLLLRRPDDTHCGGLWSLPGGKAAKDETPLVAAIRELREETGLAGKSWRELGETVHSYPDRKLHFLLFACRCPETDGFAPESEAAWVSLANLERYPMPEANAAFISLLQPPEA